MHLLTTVNLPVWAANAVIKDNYRGLTDSMSAEIIIFKSEYEGARFEMQKSLFGDIVIEWNDKPEFGEPCNCVETRIWVKELPILNARA